MIQFVGNFLKNAFFCYVAYKIFKMISSRFKGESYLFFGNFELTNATKTSKKSKKTKMNTKKDDGIRGKI